MEGAGRDDELRSRVDARVGGAFRVSLTYDDPAAPGKTSRRTDTFHGRFVELVPDERVVEIIEFETEDRAMRGEMTVTYRLVAVDGETDVFAVHDGLPARRGACDNAAGRRMSLAKLAAFVESR